jgi:hypothetical protein
MQKVRHLRRTLSRIRANTWDQEILHLAEAFRAPIIINASIRDGSLRQTVAEKDIPYLLYEAGEALRFEDVAIREGIRYENDLTVDLSPIPFSVIFYDMKIPHPQYNEGARFSHQSYLIPRDFLAWRCLLPVYPVLFEHLCRPVLIYSSLNDQAIALRRCPDTYP